MASSTVLVVLGVLVHIIYLFSVFDIYFTSPLVHGMTPYKSSHKAPAKRLVLFVADGLRADKLFELENGLTTRAPYLRDVMLSTGRWGVSHTRVPTESRPGHVAVIAGFYEDVSAVAKGWKDNPVEFDSVFNESRNTWSWGSPDILPMFAKGASGGHVWTDMYEAEKEDFAGKDNSKLDTWVFDRVEKFLESTNETIQEKLGYDQNVFFLHLLGLDTNGHAHRPISEEYLRNIKTVDDGVKKTVKLFEKHFNYDNSTAYVLTSDHGMTNWGSHGAGHPHETLTPLVAWGAGIKGPEVVEHQEYSDGFSANWNLSNVKRCDVSQADIAPLMSSLIGVPFPLNSVGVLPLDYLNNTDLYKVDNLLTNAKQILAQYLIKEQMRKESSLVFRQFSELTGSMQVAYLRNITISTKAGHYEKAMNLSRHLIELSLKGLNYYQKYDRVLLSAMVTLGFLGWIGCVILQVFQEFRGDHVKATNLASAKSINMIFLGIGCVAIVLLRVEHAAVMHYLYFVLPLVCWNYVARHHTLLRRLCAFPVHRQSLKLLLNLLLVLLGLEVLVLSFFYRYILSVGLILLASWPLSTPLRKTHVVSVALWVTHCLALSCFPLFPVVGRDPNYLLVTLAGILSLISVAIILVIYRKNQGIIEPRTVLVLGVQILILIGTVGVLNHTVYNLSKKQGLPKLNQIFSWSTIASSIILPTFCSGILVLRLVSTTLSMISVYLLLSTSYEGLFLVILASTMAVWLTLEHQLSQNGLRRDNANTTFEKCASLSQIPVHDPQDSRVREVSFDDLRCAFIFVFFIILGFFGTGNIASINSFDLSSIYCFLTVFSPFIMGSLLVFKVVIPFIVVTCVFDAVHVVCRVPVNRLFLLVLVMTDLMALQFFYLVRDHGSWLEIGTSISHYVILLSFIIFLLLIFGVARFFTRSTRCTHMTLKSHHL